MEHEWNEAGAGVGVERAALREKHFAQPLARLRRLVTAMQPRVMPKSGLGQACAYLLGHWTPLTAHKCHSHTRLGLKLENGLPTQLEAGFVSSP